MLGRECVCSTRNIIYIRKHSYNPCLIHTKYQAALFLPIWFPTKIIIGVFDGYVLNRDFFRFLNYSNSEMQEERSQLFAELV